MNEVDTVRVHHMLEAAQIAIAFIEGETRPSLDRDVKLRLALTKTIEVVGEAASKISPEARAAYPQIPWTSIVGMRNVLIHGYFNIDLDKLWNTATLSLPPLITQLERILNPPQTG